MKTKTLIFISFFIILIVTACTAGANDLVNTVAKEGEAAGFWLGLWQGFISPVTFIISLFKDTISIYEVHNNGGWYNFGFLFGAMMIFSGSCKGTVCKNKSPKEKEWENIGVKVEEKVRTGIKSWLNESEHKDKDWDEIGKKIEDKIKRELSKWADK